MPTKPVAYVAQQSIAARATLVLSDRDRAVFFDVLIDPPGPNDRLKAAFAEHARRVER
ncbi:type II toxin-antitoxin system TacA family antitoxin [Methylobacterium sp. Gmos1]